MKRDLELVRVILLRLEEEETLTGWSDLVDQGFALEAVHYHVQLLDDAGLIKADELVPGRWLPERMTWSGHEFLDAARSESVWRAARQRIEAGVGSVPFELVRELLFRLARENLEIEDEPMPPATVRPARRRK